MGSEGCDSSSPVSSCPVLSSSHQCSLSQAASTPSPKPIWSGLDLGALAMEHLHKLQAMEHHICPC